MCESFAAMNSIAEPFGHAATHAPQPMHAAASIARSACSFGTVTSFASGAEPLFAVMKPPAAITLSNARAIDAQILQHRERRRAPRLDPDLVVVLVEPHVELARRGALVAAVRTAVDHQRAHAADAFAAIVIERDRLFALRDQLLVEDVEHLEERRVRRNLLDLVRDELAGRRRAWADARCGA